MLPKRIENIHAFATSGDTKGVLRELRKGVPVDQRDTENSTPLAHAAGGVNSSIEVMQLLIDSGAAVNAKIEHGKNRPIGLAACSGNTEKVKLLIQAGAEINFPLPNGYTVLINAAYKLNSSDALLPMVKFLVKAGAEIDSETHYGESALSVTSRFGRFDVVKVLLEAGADPKPLSWSKLMQVVAIGTLDELKKFQLNDGDIRQRDRAGRSAWHLAVNGGDLEKVRHLFELGFDLNDRSGFGQTALIYAAEQGNVEILSWLIDTGADIEAQNDAKTTALMSACASGRTDCVRILLQAGANPTVQNEYKEKAITFAQNEETVRLLIEAGEDIGNVSTEMKRRLLGFIEDRLLNIDQAQAVAGCQRVFGRSNPQLMEIPFWQAMIRAGVSAYQAQAEFQNADLVCPTWCFDRYGMSFTELPDGRIVQIGGEHEDFYDENFCIYNEVVVHERDGRFKIYSYPEEVFPPTDFHTATYVNGFIYVVGGLGYKGTRQFGITPVYRLDCRTWSMEQISTNGENPGWIHGHQCKVEANHLLVVSGGTVCVEKAGVERAVDKQERSQLDLRNMKWARV